MASRLSEWMIETAKVALGAREMPRYRAMSAIVNYLQSMSDRTAEMKDIHNTYKGSEWCKSISSVTDYCVELEKRGYVRMREVTTSAGGRARRVVELRPDLHEQLRMYN